MKAMVLCAGFGKRLLPLTLGRAKPAIPFMNRPFVVAILNELAKHGVGESVINLHHLPETLRSLEPTFPAAMKVRFTEETDRILGTAGGLKNAQEFLDDGTFLMVNSDTVFSIDIGRIVSMHRERAATATMVLRENPDPVAFPPITVDGEGRVVAVAGRPESRAAVPGEKGYLFTGIHVLEPSVFDFIPPGVPYEIIREVYPAMLKKGLPLFGVVTEEAWFEAGTLRRYLESTRDSMDAFALRGPVTAGEARVSPAARVDSDCVVGPGARVEEGARVSGSVLLERCRIGAAALVTGSIVDRDVEVPAGMTIENRCLSIDPVSRVPIDTPIPERGPATTSRTLDRSGDLPRNARGRPPEKP